MKDAHHSLSEKDSNSGSVGQVGVLHQQPSCLGSPERKTSPPMISLQFLGIRKAMHQSHFSAPRKGMWGRPLTEWPSTTLKPPRYSIIFSVRHMCLDSSLPTPDVHLSPQMCTPAGSPIPPHLPMWCLPAAPAVLEYPKLHSSLAQTNLSRSSHSMHPRLVALRIPHSHMCTSSMLSGSLHWIRPASCAARLLSPHACRRDCSAHLPTRSGPIA